MSTDEEVTNSDTEQSKDDLKERVQRLEQQLDALTPDDVSRRAVLTGGAVGLGSLLGGYYTGRAEAGSQSAGQIGTEANPADFWSEDNYIKSQSGDPAAPSSTNDVVFYNKSGSLYKRDGSGTVSSLGGVQNPMQAALDAAGNDITNVGSLDTGELNNIAYLDPNATEFGAALSDALSRISVGGLVRIPSGDYDWSTQVTVGKDCAIVADGDSTGTSGALVSITGDSASIIGGEGVSLYVEGIHADATGSAPNNPLIRARSKSKIIDCGAHNWSPDIIHINPQTSNDNANHTVVKGAWGTFGNNAVVRIEDSDGGSNTNAMWVDVVKSLQMDYAIDDAGAAAVGNYYNVQSVEGSDQTAGINMAGQRCYGRVIYSENNVDPVVKFEDNQNTAELIWPGAGGGAWQDNGGNNKVIVRSRMESDDVTKTGSSYTIATDTNIRGDITQSRTRWESLSNEHRLYFDRNNEYGNAEYRIFAGGSNPTDATEVARIHKNGDMDLAGSLNENAL